MTNSDAKQEKMIDMHIKPGKEETMDKVITLAKIRGETASSVVRRILAAREKKLILPDGTFRPENETTRAEACAMVCIFLKNLFASKISSSSLKLEGSGIGTF